MHVKKFASFPIHKIISIIYEVMSENIGSDHFLILADSYETVLAVYSSVLALWTVLAKSPIWQRRNLNWELHEVLQGLPEWGPTFWN